MNYEDKKQILDDINKNTETNIFLLDGYEDALIGYEHNLYDVTRAVYDVDKCIDILMNRDGMGLEEAWEYFEFNTVGAIDRKDNRYPLLIRNFDSINE